jgi:SAM-dependent methyltransferase
MIGQWVRLQRLLSASKRLVDLGCGANPHPKASVAVDALLKPVHRSLGHGPELDSNTFRKRGIWFVQADLAALPFSNNEFDFAYSHHVFEHLPDPKKACSELCRIAQRGAIITPSPFAEIAFGRPYHLWLVLARGNKLIFVKKLSGEDRPFGEHPIQRGNGGYSTTEMTNPFDILLNEGGWYQGNERMPRLSHLLREYWDSHSPVMEVVFLWEGSFDCIVVQEDGSLE